MLLWPLEISIIEGGVERYLLLDCNEKTLSTPKLGETIGLTYMFAYKRNQYHYSIQPKDDEHTGDAIYVSPAPH